MKSSIAANLATTIALASSGKRRVLLLDADPQGNLTSDDLGVDGDLGRSLAVVMQMGGSLDVLTARQGVDIVPGGQHMSKVPTAMVATGEREVVANNLRAALLEVAADYSLIIIDSPPGDTLIIEALLDVATHLVIPTKEDGGSLKGIRLIGRRFQKAVSAGSHVELVGVVLCDVNPRATARNAATRKQIADLVSEDGVLSTIVPTDRGSAKDMRERHLTAAELVTAGSEHKAQLLASLRAGTSVDDRLWSRDSASLATAYQHLTREILGLMKTPASSGSTAGAM